VVRQPREPRSQGPAGVGVRGPVPSRGRAAGGDGQGDGIVHRERPRGEEARVAAAAGGAGENYTRLRESLGELKLNTVCVEAQCPNIGEVFFPLCVDIVLVGLG
jgi:hypothetical protein